MIDQLINLVRQNAGEAIVKNPAIPNEKNDEAIQDVAQNIFGGLKDQVQGGNLSSLVSMFSSGASTSNPAVSQIVSRVAGSLASKFGVSPQTAQQIASSILPVVMSQFVNKAKDPNDKDFDLQDIVSKVGGGNVDAGDLLGKITGGSGGIGGALGKMFGN